MKIFISADLEGCAGVTSWSETMLGNEEHYKAAEEMTLEVIAACEGLLEAGVTDIVVKDAHDSGKNIFHDRLPSGVRIIREWTGSPYSMVQGLDSSFDGAVFIGYHSAASMTGNPLSHTMDTKASKIMLNDMICSEYLLHAYAAAAFSVPVIMISGDQMICEWAESFNPNISIAPVKEGFGSAVLSLNRKDATDLIRKQAFEAMNKIQLCSIEMPDSFRMSIAYHQHVDALRASYYPGVVRTGPYEVSFKTQNITELLTTRMFIL
ncbi:MAG: M55 family metallopeptidase [Tissierellales bacterium]|nr:M55 family metallopeptidase [Tissierellales bacterium]MBN2827081.1 M55 family metallopeptidase [Tissierellales bacterium]